VVALPTGITSQPAGGVFLAGNTIVMTVAATGTPAFQYLWFKDGLPLPAAIGESLVISSAKRSNSGVCNVSVPGQGGTMTSMNATVRVQAPPPIARQPVDATGPALTANTASLAVGGAIDTTFDPRGNRSLYPIIDDDDRGAATAAGRTRVLPPAGPPYTKLWTTRAISS
jgi:hypothetical protein